MLGFDKLATARLDVITGEIIGAYVAARQAMHTPQAIESLSKQGYEPLDAGPDEFAAYMRSEIARWSEVARNAGLVRS